MRKKLLGLAVIMLLLVAVTGVSAITFGVPDEGEHPFVGTLAFVDADGVGIYSCTGTLLSPTLVLTAGHCVSTHGDPNMGTWVNFDEEVSIAGLRDTCADAPNCTFDEIAAWFDARSETWHRATVVQGHPGYFDFAEFPYTYDVGVALLDTPYFETAGEFGALPPLGLLESLVRENRKERQFVAVGYGMQGYINPFYSDIWARYKGDVSLIEINSHLTGEHSAKFTNNPGKGTGVGGTCYGDSGGPLFWKDTNLIGAVVSWGNTPCIGVDYQFRVDTSLAQDFIAAFCDSYNCMLP